MCLHLPRDDGRLLLEHVLHARHHPLRVAVIAEEPGDEAGHEVARFAGQVLALRDAEPMGDHPRRGTCGDVHNAGALDVHRIQRRSSISRCSTALLQQPVGQWSGNEAVVVGVRAGEARPELEEVAILHHGREDQSRQHVALQLALQVRGGLRRQPFGRVQRQASLHPWVLQGSCGSGPLAGLGLQQPSDKVPAHGRSVQHQRIQVPVAVQGPAARSREGRPSACAARVLARGRATDKQVVGDGADVPHVSRRAKHCRLTTGLPQIVEHLRRGVHVRHPPRQDLVHWIENLGEPGIRELHLGIRQLGRQQ
mmetsp:Transcript_147361/g.473522  ORF Transcript_147361/g.473522 Transcript_147361/m.473522 type:complete len:310 (-) Transcript_147361:574-1503(-)